MDSDSNNRPPAGLTEVSSSPRRYERGVAPAEPPARAAREGDGAPRIPSLDGVRAISISLVMLSHLSGTFGFPTASNLILKYSDLGTLGVRVFFVISGFLITGLLLKEVEGTGRISLPRFYFRRTLRIFPAYYAFLLVVMIGALLGFLHLLRGDLLAAVTYTMNYHWDTAWDLGHAWSLAVEEQFYLLWPITLVAFGVRRGLWVAASFVLAAPLIRIALLIPAGGAAGIGSRFETVGDAIAAGCLLALLRPWLWEQRRYRAVLQSRWFALVPVIILALSVLPVLALRNAFGLARVFVGFHSLVGITLMNVGLAMCLDWAIRNDASPIGRFLNLKVVAYVGTISYSLYLWQQVFLNRNEDHFYTHFPMNLVLAFGFAILSYHVIERPVLRVRQNVEQRWKRRAVMRAGSV